MQAIKFLKKLKEKGLKYQNVWLNVLTRLEFTKNQEVVLIIPDGISRTTYNRIIDFGISIFNDFIPDVAIVKKSKTLQFNQRDLLSNSDGKEIIIPEVVIINKKTKKQNKTSDETIIEVYKEIIGYLNKSTNKKYKYSSATNQALIKARIKEGYTVDDFKRVIDVKCVKWMNSNMQDYLRPQTLFSDKFEAYLNENIITQPNQQKQNYDKAIEATELGWNSTS